MASPLIDLIPDLEQEYTGSTKNDDDRRSLFDYAMKGEWDEAMRVYGQHPWLHLEKITKSGDTALHIAVSYRKESIVEKMVKLVTNEGVLKSQNEKGNTPLHLAASIGNVSMCECFAGKCKDLVSIFNNDGETPLFLAARHGKIEAFICLLHKGSESNLVDRRNKKGETILHCAIAGGHIKLAFLIIETYEDLGSTYDEEGVSPLHLLANQPSAFRSGTRLSLFDKIIYHCILVFPPSFGDADKSNHPAKRQMRVKLLPVLWNRIKGSTGGRIIVTFIKICINPSSGAKAKKASTDLDEEMPAQAILGHGLPSTPDQGPHEHNTEYEKEVGLIQCPNDERNFPVNYDTCFNFTMLLIKAILLILSLGQGPSYIDKIQQKKENHVWSAKVLKKLLDKGKGTWYDSTGKDPLYKDRTILYEGGDLQEAQGPILSSGSILSTEIPQMQPQWEKSSQEEGKDLGKAGGSNCSFEELHPECEKSFKEKIENKDQEKGKLWTPILTAAKNGIMEMVESILDYFPMAIHDVSLERKNVVLLAVENKHPHVYEALRKRASIMTDSVFGTVDNNGNSALHLAAMFTDNRPWLTPGAALQMQWEVKWFKYVKKSMPPNFFPVLNDNNESPQQIFTDRHKDLVQKGGEWLNSTATSCSVVSTLIATVAFATSTTLPGGNKENSGMPILELKPAFHLFAVSSLVALCFSITSTIMFLAILTSRHQEKDFARDLPSKLLAGLTSLFLSILAILVSFCSAHFFVLQKELRAYSLPIYAVTCLPVTLFAIAQLPLYVDIIWVTFSTLPQPPLDDNS